MDSKDLLSLLKEPLFFDDWVAANFKAINLSSDWLAAEQSPYQILGGDPEALRLRAERASRARAGGEGQARVPASGAHASPAPHSAARGSPAVAMAAVAVLRNDPLQAFLQVGPHWTWAGGERAVWICRDPGRLEDLRQPCAGKAARVGRRGVQVNLTPNLGVQSVASEREGSAGVGKRE